MALLLNFIIFNSIIFASFTKSDKILDDKKKLESNPTGNFPFYVLIKQGDLFWCPGSIIHPQWVITSWHCGYTLDIEELTHVESYDQLRRVKDIKQAQDYVWSLYQETPFLVQLVEPFKMTLKTQFIAVSQRKLPELQAVKVVGDENLNELRFDYFISVRIAWDKKMILKPLTSKFDCHVSSKYFQILRFVFK